MSDWRERVEGDDFRELEVSAVLELTRGDKFGIPGNSERHSKPGETSPLLGPEGKDKSSVVASVSGIPEDSEVDETSSLLETPRRDTDRVIAWSSIMDDPESHLEVDELLLEIAVEDVFIIIA